MEAPTTQLMARGEVQSRLRGLWQESGDASLRDLAHAIDHDGVDAHRDRLCTRLMENYRATGSGAAYSLLFEVASRQFLGVISSRLRRQCFLLDAQDVLQEVFFNIYRYPYRFKADRPESFRNWANTIVRNTILKFARERTRDGHISYSDEEIEARVDPRQRSPLHEAIRDESTQLCARAYLLYLVLYSEQYNRLSLKERQSLHMVEVEGRSYKEVSETLGIKLENLKMVIFRARNKIVRNLDRALNALSAHLS
jgi:RNA polymerase sigma-70 factor (ECF subfamily)